MRVKNNESVEVQDYLDIGIASQQLTVYVDGKKVQNQWGQTRLIFVLIGSIHIIFIFNQRSQLRVLIASPFFKVFRLINFQKYTRA